jgi:hypothetical protein
MAQIFLSHSQRDEHIKDLFLRAFRGAGVSDIYREYENAPPTGVTAELIAQDIERSSAVFVLLSETVETLPSARDWILFECGIAAAKQKPVWVFEPCQSFGRITTIIPRFDHYVRFNDSDPWRQYLNSIAASYNDTPMLGRIVVTILGGIAFGFPGALVSLLGGVALFQTPERPAGYLTSCPLCKRSFAAHLPDERQPFRCPNCRFDPLYLRPEFVPVFQ